jgi:hypothetical protein
MDWRWGEADQGAYEAVWLRMLLANARADGVPFEQAWQRLVPYVCYAGDEDAMEWREAFEEMRESWQAAYEGSRPPTRGERALAEWAAAIPPPPAGPRWIATGEDMAARCEWCDELLPEGRKPSRYCPPPKRCKRQAAYARERDRLADSRTPVEEAASGRGPTGRDLQGAIQTAA